MFGRRRDDELDRELKAHLEQEADEQREAGLSPEDARFAAQRALGNAALIKEESRDVWTWTWLEQLGQDVRYALRGMRKSPGFTAVAVISLALGIGANTAIFTLIDRLMLRMLPVREPRELVLIKLIEKGRTGDSLSYPVIQALDERRDIFAGVAGFSGAMFNTGPSSAVERVSGAWVSGAYFETLGLTSPLGRLLAREDDRPGAQPAAVLSYHYWERQFNRDPLVIGQTLRIEGNPIPIIGVLPAGFNGAEVGWTADITMTLAVLAQIQPERAALLEAGPQWLRVLARPAPGLTRDQVNSRLAVIWPGMASVAVTPKMHPERRQALLNSTLAAEPGGTGWTPLRNEFSKPLMMLMIVASLVLLIACANVANLLLARASARRREIAVRLAIGSGRGRIIRQLLTESVLLSSISAGFGLGVAWWGSRLLVNLLSSGRRQTLEFDLQPDWHVLGFAIAAAFITAILFGLAPAFRATTGGPGAALKEDARNSHGVRGKLPPSLVVFQLALSLVLLTGTGLFVRSLWNLQHLDPGFRHEGVLLMNVDARRAGYEGERLAVFYQNLLSRLAQLPGIQSASLSMNTPLSGGIYSGRIAVDGQAPSGNAHFNAVSPGYFATLRTPLLTGRDFTMSDDANAPPVAVVNEEFARRYLGAGQALGRHVATEGDLKSSAEIIGVVKDAVSYSLREPPPPAVYMPYFQRPKEMGVATFEVYAAGSLTQTAQALQSELRAVLPQTPVQMQVQPLTEQVGRAMIAQRVMATLATGFGVLALILAAVGLYGLLVYTVVRRTGEIGIRMALGARQRQVQWLVLGGALKLVTLGIVLGLPAALAVTRLVDSMLYGLKPNDPATLVSAAALLAAVAVLAGYLPARRASKVDPIVALRYE